MMRSYAQNFEDVLLWRVLGDVPRGFYIDLGAQHPIQDSVSKFFYEQGWRGIHVEPLQLYSDLLRQDRPDEDVIQAAISEQPGNLVIYAFADTGLSTADLDIALTHKANLGRDWVEEIIPSMTLAQVFERAGRDDIHWLKIDVEGHERSALASWGDSAVRPWIVLVEATYPNTQIETHQKWEFLLVSRGYNFVYADGLNRYYLHEMHEDRRTGFRYPPNYFDQFSLGDHWATYDLRERHRQSLDEAREAQCRAETQAADRDAKYTNAISRLADDLGAEVAQTVSILTGLSARLDGLSAELQENRDLLRQIAIRSDEHAAYLQALSSEFEGFGENVRSVLSNPWFLLKSLLGFQKSRLLKRESPTYIARAGLLPASPEAPLDSGLVERMQDSNNLGQGLFDLTEVSCPPLLSLAEMYALPPKAFLTVAYRVLLERDPDAKGLSYYLGRLASGDSRSCVLASMVRGKEFRRRHSHKDLMRLDTDQFIKLAYIRILGRKPDDAGKEYYSGLLRRGKSKANVLRNLGNSREARTRSDPAIKLRDAIRSLAAPQHRLSRWLANLGQGPITKQISRLDFSLSTLIDRLEHESAEEVGSSRAVLHKRFQRHQHQGAANESGAGVPLSTPDAAFRPRWVPRDIRYARRDISAGGSEKNNSIHPEFLRLSERMKREAPFGELQDAAAGQEEIDDFLEGAYPREDHGNGPVRWIGREGSIYVRVTGPQLMIEASGFFCERKLQVLIENIVLKDISFIKGYSVASAPVKEWINKEVSIRFKCDDVFNPHAAGVSSDQRDLGLMIRSMYFA